MIPFGSQRAYGQDLATHLLNAQDNERLEVWQVRGAVDRGLHGAFAEWEAQAHGLTRCTNYLYSLSINPDQRQGRLSREQYLDYIERTEQRLGLSGQPRAVVFHVKKDRQGVPREHCHVVWSRIDVEQKKARPIAYDHEKLMMVTREYARDHGLRLPDGYNRETVRARRGRGYQMGLDDKRAEELGGLSLEQHKARVTAAWDRRDTARSFVRELEDMGYILATGTRDYVLVDLFGNMKALPRLIDDRGVRVKHLREFLGKDFPKDSLPSVEEARALAAAHRAAKALFERSEERAAREAREQQRREELQRKQQPRRQAVAQEAKALSERQQQARHEHAERQKEARAALRQGYLQEARRIKIERAAHRPKGLAAFLGRVTGVELITKKVQQYRDATRFKTFLAQKKDLAERQQRERPTFERQQVLQALAMQRRLRALELVEQRERKSLEVALLKDRRIEERERDGRALVPSDPSRSHTDVFNDVAKAPVDLGAEFARAATALDGRGEQDGGAARDPVQQEGKHTNAFNERAKQPVELTAAFERAAKGGDDDGSASGDTAQEPAPEAEVTIRRRKRTRERPEEPERKDRGRRADQDRNDDDPSPDSPRRQRRNRDFDRGR
jgi:hypothetical protein